MIETKETIPVDHQRLFFNDARLEAQKTVYEQGLREGSTLTLKIDDGTRELNVETEHNYTFKIIVKVEDTIEDVKDKIQEKESIPKDQQRLFLAEEELENAETVKHYGLKKGDTVKVKAGIFIQVSDVEDLILFSFYARTTDTILSIKEKIQEKNGVTPEKLALKLAGNTGLLQPSKTVADYDITQGATITFRIRVKILVKTPEDSTLEFLILPSAKVSAVKTMIESKSEVPVDHQRLFLRGAELDDEKTVKE